MKTTININGLDVEFTDQKPTRPGAYWRFDPERRIHNLIALVNDGGSLVTQMNKLNIDSDFGLWSAPLVPVTEVEKASFEGAQIGYSIGSIPGASLDENFYISYKISNARKVVEGIQ